MFSYDPIVKPLISYALICPEFKIKKYPRGHPSMYMLDMHLFSIKILIDFILVHSHMNAMKYFGICDDTTMNGTKRKLLRS